MVGRQAAQRLSTGGEPGPTHRRLSPRPRVRRIVIACLSKQFKLFKLGPLRRITLVSGAVRNRCAAIILQRFSNTVHSPCPRRQGSVHLPLWRRLAQQAAAGRLAVLEGFELADAAQQNSAGAGNTSWVLTLKRSELGADPAGKASGPSLFQQAVAAAAAAAAAAAGAAPAPGTPNAAGEAAGPPAQPPAGGLAPQQQQQLLRADEVWLACGSAYNAAADPVLADLARQAPAPLTGGYPWLDDEFLCWPGAPVFLLGRGAMLSVGPSAGELQGGLDRRGAMTEA